MFALGIATVKSFFAQLYATPDIELEPFSGGRQMNAHFSSRSLQEDGSWNELKNMLNSSADSSPTASQMLRALGLAQASTFYRNNPELQTENPFSNNGNEVVFASIGDASTSEGIFWETINAAGVLQVPLAVSIWDDGYGISVPKKYQTTKGSISEVLSGFASDQENEGFDIYTVKGWDYPNLVSTYKKGIEKVRKTHKPAIFHIQEVTQPQGHSTSGSHERYKSKERLEWEKEYDCIKKLRDWILENKLAEAGELDALEADARNEANQEKKAAWENYIQPLQKEISEAEILLEALAAESKFSAEIKNAIKEMKSALDPFRREISKAVHFALRTTTHETSSVRTELATWYESFLSTNKSRFGSHLHSESKQSLSKIEAIDAQYSDASVSLNGYEILNQCFDNLLQNNNAVLAFGEDVGKIGDVNQGFAGLQDKFGEHRVFDTGIREASIMGQAIGLAMRGLRPIAEIQYLDYLIYGLQPLADDLACLQFRTKGGQKAPCIIRTRGHRLEGIWHTGSPMGMIINSLRGIAVLVPRNVTQAAGFYNALIKSDEPALVIECLNGYRRKERRPDNLFDFTLKPGVIEVLKPGTDITMVSYGSTLRICEEAIELLEKFGVSIELIDIQSLLPFDTDQNIFKSIKKTNRLVVVDEDVPGGASAYILQKILEEQGTFRWLDSQPLTITAKDHRAAYASDGDYFGKPSVEEIFTKVYNWYRENDPTSMPELHTTWS